MEQKETMTAENEALQLRRRQRRALLCGGIAGVALFLCALPRVVRTGSLLMLGLYLILSMAVFFWLRSLVFTTLTALSLKNLTKKRRNTMLALLSAIGLGVLALCVFTLLG
ncbi:hypothetical protein LJC07_01130 [Christensenellaceae bacterium OttesenSCG-928-L17]|nr:hypothetical protein [Christensenellaceae bacterium OttesenSCG-928-L17]